MTYSPTNVCSTIGAVGLNFSVRNGKRWIPDAINRLNMCTVHLYNTLQEKEYESQTSENSFVEQFSLFEASLPVIRVKHWMYAPELAPHRSFIPARKEKLSGN